ncbi:MAG: hypothetical protein ACK526_19945 [Planctomyces sp.]|jgi:hypothetical protein
MKWLTLSLIIHWIVLTLELTWPSALPRGCVLLPVSCGMLFWRRTPSALAVFGGFLLLDQLIRPVPIPLCAFVLPVLSAMLLSPEKRNYEFRSRRAWVAAVPAALHLPLLTVLAVSLQKLSVMPATQASLSWNAVSSMMDDAGRVLLVAIPLSAVFSLGIRIADEFGLRRSIQTILHG